MPSDVRVAIEQGALAFVHNLYRHHEITGCKEPCISIAMVTDVLRQGQMPDEFRYNTKGRQRSWVRSVLETLRRRGELGSSIGGTGHRCYEPGRGRS